MMKTKFYQVLTLLSFTVILLAATPASAQEGSPETPELSPIPDNDLKEDKPLLYEPEGKTSNPTSLQKEPAVISPGNKSKSKNTDAKSSAKQEDDALSFNFLYYIIQKFKISDIVDQ